MSTLVTLDLDDLACYHAIHGLPAPAPETARLALEVWLPRFLDVFAKLKVRATIFVIGRDLERDLASGGRGAVQLVRALDEGHELANHSHAHAYDLHDWPADAIAEDLRRCDALLRELGTRPRGFRAPGYTHDRTLLLQVAALGYDYDSSLLPSPTYFLAKLGVLGLGRLRGRSSVSQATGLRSFVGSTAVHYLPEIGLWELPIGVSLGMRIPMTGTFLLADALPLFGNAVGKTVAEGLRAEAKLTRHLHLELHAIDLADPSADGLDPALLERTRELNTPLERRLARLVELFEARGGGTSIVRTMNRHLRP
ncbi:polysaccharide deacetylase family protein [Nannocystaceae bacterium ST9]